MHNIGNLEIENLVSAVTVVTMQIWIYWCWSHHFFNGRDA